MSEAAYPNPLESKSENPNAPRLSLELVQERTPRSFSNHINLHLELHRLYEAGLIAKFRDEDGVERFQPIGEPE